MEANATTVIDRPPEAVFEYMDVPENQARISPRLSAVETLGTLDTGGKRASYTYRLFGLSFGGEVRGVEHEPPERIVFELTGDIGGRIEWDFEPVEGGTRVTYTATYDLGFPPLLDRLLGPVADRINRRELEATLENLHRRL
ncbi:SRPBCC family protein [Natronomonas sp. F2-12]|jgi:carbon monoxide dehydrogenase subunit G|uniref:SRPBCC family protein n=1 Tax=Natronomonas aquatica TaxID=2841590 RepID=A0A9R1CUD8_9EURY|nr:SRPBCC family protein [Natronomonas aquatica]MCQ4334142.1 SRPBCC family protein [Natronomonas aquatica]